MTNLRARDAFAGTTSTELGLWFFLVTDAILFAGLLLVCGLLRARGPEWPAVSRYLGWPSGVTMALLLGISSFAMQRAQIKKETRARRHLLVAVLNLGLGLLGLQGWEWHQAWRSGFRWQSFSGGPASFAASFFVLTGFHALHVAVGVLGLAVLTWGSFRRVTEPSPKLGLVSLYWQYAVLSWIPLGAFFYFNHWFVIASFQVVALVILGWRLRRHARALRLVTALPLFMVIYALALAWEVQGRPQPNNDAWPAAETADPVAPKAPVPPSNAAADEWR